MSESKNYHTILIGELMTDNDYVTLKVSDKFLKTIKKAPKKIIKRPDNAYIFGKKYKLSDYKKIGDHSNDMASTGILLYDINQQKMNEIKNSDLWNEIYHIDKKYKKSLNWDDRKALKKIQAQLSDKILFVGETIGGDVGADVYVHRTNKCIDSIIIDTGCFLKQDK